jgi:diguanylate cyclase
MLKLFRGEKTDPPAPPPPPKAPPPPPTGGDSGGDRTRDEELETLGQVLRYLGEEAFDVADDTADHIAALFSAWSRHLLVLAPHPDEPDEPVRHRDFIGLRRFVQQFRHREVGYVKKTLKELRSVLWVMVGQLGSAVLSDRTTDKQAKQQLARLQRAVGAGSLDELQREAMATVDCLNEIIEQRRDREQKQVEALREQIQAINEELTQTRQEMALDPLTRLFNRGALDERLERTACLAALTGQDAALFMVDLDHFKQVNDTHGHPVGDLVLKAVADACVRCFPRQRDFVARYGGEEIAIVGFDAPVSSLKMLGERILAAVRTVKVQTPAGAVVTLTASVGVAPLRPGETAPEWMRRADEALYAAKNGGRNRAVIAEAG